MAEELKIKISAEGSGQVKQELSKTQQALGAFKSGVSSIGRAVGSLAKVTGAAIMAGGAAIASLATSAVKAYADYEQLSGGVQKLFGQEASQTMMQYAQNAYMTAGMSANQYMELSTSFAASLIQSYGGDTAKAVDMTDVAMRAISDNFNTFGGDINSVKAAFQGFAKQNYTMLDNLKLGYGGTKTEMERLIADANEYAASIGRASDLSIENFGDIVEAIDLIQQKQGIAGTTAAEAASTISGSLMMTKAAWQNLLVAFADGNADMDKAFNALLTSAEIAFNNILPVAERAIIGISDFITRIAPTIGEKLPALIAQVLPGLLSAGASLITALATGVAQAAPAIVAAIPQILSALKEGLVAAAPALKEAGQKLISMVGEGMAAAGEWVVDKAHTLWTDILGGSEETWEQMKTSTQECWNSIQTFVGDAWEGIKAGASAFGEGIKAFWGEHGSSIMETFSNTWSQVSGIFSSALSVISNLAQSVFTGLQNFWSTWGGTITTVFSSAWNIIKTVFSSALNIIKGLLDVFAAAFSGDWSACWEAVKSLASTIWSSITSILSAAWNGIKAVATSVFGVIGSYISGVWGNITSAVSSAWGNIKSAVSSGVNAVKSTISSVFGAISGTVSSVWSGIKSTITSTMDSIKGKIQSAVNAIKNVFNFSWKLPSLKLPHFTVSGSFSLNPPSVPSFGISWYAKGGVFDMPTLFGYGKGNIGGLGENGAEAVVPLENNTQWLDRLAERLSEKIANRPIVMEVDGKVFGQVACDSINGLTRQTGKLNIMMA